MRADDAAVAVVQEQTRKGRGTKQDYGTPRAFIESVEARFGALRHDLAASAHNAKALAYWTVEHDALSHDWAQSFPTGNLWLNPPFDNIEPWVEKASVHAQARLGWILVLTPASIGSRWYARWCAGSCLTIPLLQRMTFEGMAPNPKTGRTDPYPKDLMLMAFGYGVHGVQTPWAWRRPSSPEIGPAMAQEVTL